MGLTSRDLFFHPFKVHHASKGLKGACLFTFAVLATNSLGSTLTVESILNLIISRLSLFLLLHLRSFVLLLLFPMDGVVVWNDDNNSGLRNISLNVLKVNRHLMKLSMRLTRM